MDEGLGGAAGRICVERRVKLCWVCPAFGRQAEHVALDPMYPLQQLAFMLDDSQAPVLLTMQQFAPCAGMLVR